MFLNGNGSRSSSKYAKIEQYKRVKSAEVRRDLGQLAALRRQAVTIAAVQRGAQIVGGMGGSELIKVGDDVVGGLGIGIAAAPYLMNNGVINGMGVVQNEMLQSVGASASSIMDGASSNVHFMVHNAGITNITNIMEQPQLLSAVGTGGISKPKRDVMAEFIAFIQLHKITTIYNVYQESYRGGHKATGLGDFIRGCYFLVQFCIYLKHQKGIEIVADFMVSHPMGELLGIGHGRQVSASTAIVAFDKQNWVRTEFNPVTGKNTDVLNSAQHLTDFMEFFMASAVIDRGGHAYIYTIAYPLWGSVAEHSRNVLRNMLKMGVMMTEYVERLMGVFGLVAGGYKVIHIRSGDKYLNGEGGGFRDDYKAKLMAGIRRVAGAGAGAGATLLIADNNYIKDYVVSQFPFMRAMKKDIGHLGEGQTQSIEKIRNTMADFYLMSKAGAIYSFTSYAHGSGFSRWCAETYSVPYLCFFI